MKVKNEGEGKWIMNMIYDDGGDDDDDGGGGDDVVYAILF